MKTKLIIILFFLLSGCSTRTDSVKNLSESPTTSKDSMLVKRLIGAHPLIKPRGLCEIYDTAAFGGIYFADRIETSVTKNKFGVEIPSSVVSFKRELAFDTESPESFQLKTRGGETPSGQVTTAEFDVVLGKTYLLFPIRRKNNDLFITPDGKFEEINGTFHNNYMFNKSTTKLNRAAFKSHFVEAKSTCIDVRPDNELLQKGKAMGQTKSKLEIGEEIK